MPISETPELSFWERLATPFPEDEVELLPKPYSRDSAKGQCNTPDRQGLSCGGYHGLPAVHIHYVGHAGITTRLNEVCGPDGWSWEPLATAPNGLPLIEGGCLWIKLAIRDDTRRADDGTPYVWVTKLGVGDANGKPQGPLAVKEMIGDALRNAAMRFGVGTYLWSKSDKAKATLAREAGQDADEPEPPRARPRPRTSEPTTSLGRFMAWSRQATPAGRDGVRSWGIAQGWDTDPRQWSEEQAEDALAWIDDQTPTANHVEDYRPGVDEPRDGEAPF